MDLRKYLGIQIRAARERTGISQEQLGEDIGVSKQTIYRLEKGLAWPEYENLEAIAARLGIKPEALFMTLSPDSKDPSLPQIKRDFIAEIVNLSDIEALALIPGFRALVDSFRRFHGHKEPKKLKQG